MVSCTQTMQGNLGKKSPRKKASQSPQAGKQ